MADHDRTIAHPVSRERAVEVLTPEPARLRDAAERWARRADVVEALLSGDNLAASTRAELASYADDVGWSDPELGRAVVVLLREAR